MQDTTSIRSGKVSELIAFNIGEQQFCLSTTSVREIRGWTPATPLPHAPEFVLGVVNLRGVVLPIVDLAVRLGFPPTQPGSDIFTAEDAQIQPTPEIAAETAKLYLRGVIAMEGRLIGVIDIANLLPATELAAA